MVGFGVRGRPIEAEARANGSNETLCLSVLILSGSSFAGACSRLIAILIILLEGVEGVSFFLLLFWICFGKLTICRMRERYSLARREKNPTSAFCVLFWSCFTLYTRTTSQYYLRNAFERFYCYKEVPFVLFCMWYFECWEEEYVRALACVGYRVRSTIASMNDCCVRKCVTCNVVGVLAVTTSNVTSQAIVCVVVTSDVGITGIDDLVKTELCRTRHTLARNSELLPSDLPPYQYKKKKHHERFLTE